MDPCPFVRILVGNLALKFPAGSCRPSVSSEHPSSSSYSCRIRLDKFPVQSAAIPLVQQEENFLLPNTLAACFSLDKEQIDRILSSRKKRSLVIDLYAGGDGVTCGIMDGKLLSKVTVPLDLKRAESRPCVLHNGWIDVGESKKGLSTQFYLSVRAEPDPRYVLQFDGVPECSPQVFQVQGNARQAVFTCKFGLRNTSDRNLGSRPSLAEPITKSRNWLPSLGAHKEQSAKERKGWTITVHDLSGSPVAMASMVTPFVPSPGSDRVSRSNPGAWLILRPSQGTWKSWGRLEAWRERNANALGYRFELLHDTIGSASPATSTLVNSSISAKNGGKFTIDMTNGVTTPITSAHSSCDFGSTPPGSGSWSGSDIGVGFLSPFLYKGFVMSSRVKGSGKCSKPELEIGVQHVNCTEDAAAFVALAAAVDLSVDACRSFSHKLRKELRQLSQSSVI